MESNDLYNFSIVYLFFILLNLIFLYRSNKYIKKLKLIYSNIEKLSKKENSFWRINAFTKRHTLVMGLCVVYNIFINIDIYTEHAFGDLTKE